MQINANTINATWNTLNGGAIGLELKAAGASGPQPSASLSSVSASTPIAAGSGLSSIAVTVVDGSGNPMSGVSVTLLATGSVNKITQPASVTDGNGVATGSFSSTTAGSHTVTAVAGGVTLNQQPVVTVNTGPPDASQSTVTALPTSITAGSGTSAITVTVKDQYGNGVSGSNVVLAASGTGNTLTGGGATDANGVLTGSFSSTDAETKTISAKADNLDITQTATVSVTPPGSSTISHTLLTSGNNTANQAVYATEIGRASCRERV